MIGNRQQRLYVRVKQISGRRYLYLVEGRRSAGKVEQKTLSYLGPLAKLAPGISKKTRKKVESDIGTKLDWNAITRAVTKIPLTLQELDELRGDGYSSSLKFRNRRTNILKQPRTFPKEIFRQRARGELKALAKLAAIGFDEMFEQIGERKYRMRL